MLVVVVVVSVVVDCCVVLLLICCWVVGLLGCWVVGLLGCWVVGLLGCWVVGLSSLSSLSSSSSLLWCCWFLERLLAECEFYVTSHEFLFCLHGYGQGSIKLLKTSQHHFSWYIFYTNPTLNNTPSVVI